MFRGDFACDSLNAVKIDKRIQDEVDRLFAEGVPDECPDDPVEKQKQFSDKHSFDYPLLADADGKVAEQFGVRRGGGRAKRATFVIGQDARVIEVIRSEIRMNVHADKALEALRVAAG